MIKDALEYIIGLKKPETIEIDGRTFTDGTYLPVLEPYNAKIKVHTLTGLVEIVKKELKNTSAVINVISPTQVEVLSEIYGNECQRDLYIEAKAMLPRINFDFSTDMETFIVELQSKFVHDDNRDKLLQFASRVKFDNSQEIVDNGVSQIATVKTGVAKLENVQAPNPVTLRPFRTFHEVEQPASDFVFRIDNNRSFKLVKADGGAWANEATQNIKAYLKEELSICPQIIVIA